MILNWNKNKQAPSPEVISASYLPVISMFMPFEPKMFRKADLASKLTGLQQQAELQVSSDFFVSGKKEVLERLDTVISNINFSTHKKSLAIYVTAEADKVFYLDLPLTETVMISQSYNIRSLVNCKIDLKSFLVLAIDEYSSRICLSLNGIFSTIISNRRVSNEQSDTTNFSTQIFLKQVDRKLSIILSSFSCPLFVIGTTEILNQYKEITKNNNRISEVICSGSGCMSDEQIKGILLPYIADWNKVKAMGFLQKLYEASFNRKLAVGASDVLQVAKQKKGELLIVERNYTYPVVNAYNKKIDLIKNTPAGTLFTDLVDETIEEVLKNGGDVEFVDREFLNKFMHVALIHR